MKAVRLLVTLLVLAPGLLQAQALPQTSLAVQHDGAWHTWWVSSHAPAEWRAALPELSRAVEWRRTGTGIDVAELALSGDGTAWRLDVVLVRIDPRHVRLKLEEAVRDAGMRGAWTVDSLPADAALALNAGQFTGAVPWGWLVRGGREVKAPGTGSLSMAFVIDTSGAVRFVHADAIDALRGDARIAEAFQSYPVLLRDGEVPPQLRAAERGVDVSHRDSRLAIGQLRDGRILIALTRFGALGEAAGSLPFGPTTPEMAALMGALGCHTAMLLDGGLSAQLAVRAGNGRARIWNGWRRVPLALIGYPRSGYSPRAHHSTTSSGNRR
ncbi:MAG TPA: phosphodiester glycosidase family protein [Longimicrobiales bacterium]|nr:phosphodiester glycosidase family protein [Longimicrobiales bacterium]